MKKPSNKITQDKLNNWKIFTFLRQNSTKRRENNSSFQEAHLSKNPTNPSVQTTHNTNSTDSSPISPSSNNSAYRYASM